MNDRIISYKIFRGEVKKGSFIVVRTTKMRTPTLQAVVVQIPLFVIENICLVLFRRQISIFCHCDYISFPKIMGSSAYFEVFTVRNVQIWRYSKGFKNLHSWALYIYYIIEFVSNGSKNKEWYFFVQMFWSGHRPQHYHYIFFWRHPLRLDINIHIQTYIYMNWITSLLPLWSSPQPRICGFNL